MFYKRITDSEMPHRRSKKHNGGEPGDRGTGLEWAV